MYSYKLFTDKISRILKSLVSSFDPASVETKEDSIVKSKEVIIHVEEIQFIAFLRALRIADLSCLKANSTFDLESLEKCMEYPQPSSILSFEIQVDGSKIEDFTIEAFLNGKKQKICKKTENFDPAKDKCSWKHFSDSSLSAMQTDSYSNLCRFGTDYPMDSTKLLMVYSLFGLMIFVMILGSIALIMSIE